MTVTAAPPALIAFVWAASVASPGFVASAAIAQDNGTSYSIEDVTACSGDAMRLCKDKMPDVEAIETCMKAHFTELRPKCKARFKDR